MVYLYDGLTTLLPEEEAEAKQENLRLAMMDLPAYITRNIESSNL